MAKIVFYRVVHEDYNSMYYTSFKKAYECIKDNVQIFNEDNDLMGTEYEVIMPTMKEMKEGREAVGYWITREVAF